jgi:hypothetical protein
METFVVRVFVPTGGEQLELSGVVEHPASGRNRRFRGNAGLLDVIHGELHLTDDDGGRWDPAAVERSGQEERS